MFVIAIVHNLDPSIVIYYAEDQSFPLWWRRDPKNKELQWTDRLFSARVFTNHSELKALYQGIQKIANGEYEDEAQKIFWLNKAIGHGFPPDKETGQIQCTVEIRRIYLELIQGAEIFGQLEHWNKS